MFIFENLFCDVFKFNLVLHNKLFKKLFIFENISFLIFFFTLNN